MGVSIYLKNTRNKLGLKSVEMADKLNLDRGTYSKLEKGPKTKISPKTVERIASGLKIKSYIVENDIIYSISKEESNGKYSYFFSYLESLRSINSFKFPFHLPEDEPMLYFNAAIVNSDYTVAAFHCYDSILDYAKNYHSIDTLIVKAINDETYAKRIAWTYFDEWISLYRYTPCSNLKNLTVIFHNNDPLSLLSYRSCEKHLYYNLPFEIEIVLYDSQSNCLLESTIITQDAPIIKLD